MPREPDNFDCRSVRQVLFLRLRDWMWPSALAVVVTVPLMFQTDASGTYRIGSVAHFVSIFGPPIMLMAIVFAGLRWCWLGHLRPRDANCCARCGYPIGKVHHAEGAARCSECGATSTIQRTATLRTLIRESFRGVSLARFLLDVPGLLLLLLPLSIFVIVTLIVVGVIDD
jgi:hypothetical protein